MRGNVSVGGWSPISLQAPHIGLHTSSVKDPQVRISLNQEIVDEAAVGADEGIGNAFLPFRLHARWTGGFETYAPTVKLLARALEAAQMVSINLNPGGFGVEQFHGNVPTVVDDE
jgi:hypothetical protein